MENKFNLVDEPWIPIKGNGRVSLFQLFSDVSYEEFGGTPLQKIAILKFLLAIAQTAYTPKDDEDWKDLGYRGMAKKCLTYVEQKRELFFLYGEKPFLQKSDLLHTKTINGSDLKIHKQSKSYLPDMSSENDTILFQTQMDHPLSDAERAVLLISLMNYAPGGKRVDQVPDGAKSAKAGPSLGGYVGYINSCLWSDLVIKTIWLNLMTQNFLQQFYPAWDGSSMLPPWEHMPATESDAVAENIKHSIMGALCGVSRFVLFTEEGMIYTEGLRYPSHKEGWREPFFSWNGKDQFLWLDTNKKPWRSLTALLNTPMGGGESTYNCPQISNHWLRARQNLSVIGIWSGGLQVRGNAGDQSVKQSDDFIESNILIASSLVGDTWFHSLQHNMNILEQLSKILWSSIAAYQKSQIVKNENFVRKAQSQYWDMCERHVQAIVVNCKDEEALSRIMYIIGNYVIDIYNQYCPNKTARQLTGWAKNRPSIQKVLEKKDV